MNHTYLIKHAISKMQPDNIRHPIVVEHNEDLTAIVYALFNMATNPPTNEIHKQLNAFRTLAESLFVIGYLAGREDNETVNDIWRDNEQQTKGTNN